MDRAGAGDLPSRARRAILTALLGVSALAWVYLALEAARMAAMPMADMPEMLAMRPWHAADFVLVFLMWAIMMVGMMVPSVIPMTLIYAAVARRAAREQNPIAPTAVFVSGYVLMWTLFSLGATITQWALERAALLSPMMVSNSPALGSAVLIAAGLYQFTPFKDSCLSHCRAPAQFFAAHWRPGTGGALRMGLEHGAFCLGCCWALMALLFVGGVMNLLWVAAIALFVLLEKVLPFGPRGGRLAGLAMIAAGLVLPQL